MMTAKEQIALIRKAAPALLMKLHEIALTMSPKEREAHGIDGLLTLCGKPIAPVDQMEGLVPLVLYFPSVEAASQFADLMQIACPNLKTQKT